MRHLALALALLVPAAHAHARPLGDGLVVRLEPGWAAWSLDGDRLRTQVGARAGEIDPLLVSQTQDAAALSLGLGYDILGHATLALEITGSGWDLAARERGGAGLVAFTAAWHPAALLLPDAARRWDASIVLGAGWGVLGEDRALDGLYFLVGARAEWFFTPWLSAGATLRWMPLAFSRYVVDWNADQGVDLPDGSGGALLVPSVTLAIHAPVGG